MSWATIGVVELQRTYRPFPIPLLDAETIRIVSSGADTLVGPAVLAPIWLPHGRGRAQMYYLSDDPRIFTFPIPNEIRAQGSVTWYLLARLGWQSRVMVGQNWRLEAEVFY